MTSERVQRRVERLLDQADAALEEQDYRAALQAAKAALGFDSNNAEAAAFVEAAEQALAVVTDSTGIARASEDLGAASAPSSSAGSSVETLSANPTSFAGGRYQVDDIALDFVCDINFVDSLLGS